MRNGIVVDVGKPGPKPKRLVSETWTPKLAYAVGLLATDGCLARHVSLIDLTSNDREQLENFCKCIGLTLHIGSKSSGFKGTTSLRVQLKNVYFYNFLKSIGLTPAKSKTIGALKIPAKYFWDFLRGSYDGDGSSYAYWDKRWRSSYMFYTDFVSASKLHIDWVREEVFSRLGIRGHITTAKGRTLFQLKYAKGDSLKLLRKMYYSRRVVCLSRKRLKIERILATVGAKL